MSRVRASGGADCVSDTSQTQRFNVRTSSAGSGHKKKRRRIDDKLAEAETVLRQAGYDLEKLKKSRERSSGSSDKRKSKKSRKSIRKDRGPQEAR